MLRQTKEAGQESNSMASHPAVAPYQSHAICVVCERTCFRNIAHTDFDPRPRFFFMPHSACRGNGKIRPAYRGCCLGWNAS